MRIFFLLCLVVIYQFTSVAPVCATGSVGGTFSVFDDVPPAAVGNLSAVGRTPYSIQLQWIAPGDDGNVGKATRYDIRFSTSPITNEMQWANSTLVYAVPVPKTAGSNETWTVNGLLPLKTYYFALKTADELFNWSRLSNCVKATTSIVAVELVEEEEEIEPTPTVIVPTPTPDSPPIYLDIKGKKGVVYLNLLPDGSLAQTWIITLNNKQLEMVLQKGTILLDDYGKPISVIVLKYIEPFGEPPAGFEFQAIYDFLPPCTVKPPVMIKIHYNREELDKGINEKDIHIAYYDESQKSWVMLPGTEDIVSQAVSINNNCFSPVCLLVPGSGFTPLPPPEPISPDLTITHMTLSSYVIEQGEELIVSVDVFNESDTAGDFYLPLYVDGITMDSKIVTLAAKQEGSEEFSIVFEEEGTHGISVGPMLTSITVKKPEESVINQYLWLRIPILSVVIIGLIVTLVITFMNHRKKNSAFPRRF